jgi:hypothetical protein
MQHRPVHDHINAERPKLDNLITVDSFQNELRAENLVGEEWAEWYRMTPQERFRESMKL